MVMGFWNKIIYVSLVLAAPVLNGCKPRQALLSEELKVRDQRENPSYWEALEVFMKEFSFSETFIDEGNCFQNWLKKNMDDHFVTRDGRKLRGLDLWRVSKNNFITIHERGADSKIKRMQAKVHIREFLPADDPASPFYENSNFTRKIDEGFRYELAVLRAPNLVNNFMILARHMKYFSFLTKIYQDNIVRAIGGKAISPQMDCAYYDDSPYRNRAFVSRIRSQAGIPIDPRNLEFLNDANQVFNEPTTKVSLRQFNFDFFKKFGVKDSLGIPFVGSRIGRDPYRMRAENHFGVDYQDGKEVVVKTPLRRGDLIVINELVDGEGSLLSLSQALATKIAISPFDSADEYEAHMGTSPSVIGRILPGQEEQVEAFFRELQRVRKENEGKRHGLVEDPDAPGLYKHVEERDVFLGVSHVEFTELDPIDVHRPESIQPNVPERTPFGDLRQGEER